MPNTYSEYEVRYCIEVLQKTQPTALSSNYDTYAESYRTKDEAVAAYKDQRSKDALVVAEKHAMGLATDEELADAWSAADAATQTRQFLERVTAP